MVTYLRQDQLPPMIIDHYQTAGITLRSRHIQTRGFAVNSLKIFRLDGKYDLWTTVGNTESWKIKREGVDYITVDEGQIQVATFRYWNAKRDPEPEVLVFGIYDGMLCGLNLHYLDDDEIEELRKRLNGIFVSPDIRSRYRNAYRLAPGIVEKAYRTYDEDFIRSWAIRTLKTGLSEENNK